MRKTVLIILLFTSALMLSGQGCSFFYPPMVGAELTYQNYDRKDKPTGKTVQQVTDFKGGASKASATILVKSYDDKDKEISETTLEVKCEHGVFYFDMRGYINQQSVSAYKDMDVKVETENLEIPSKLSPGLKLKDGKLTMDIFNNGFKFMTIIVEITDRVVESVEPVTTPAGTFTCYKMKSVITTRMPIRVVMSSTEWWGENTGMVKSESYNSSGKLFGRMELIKYTK